MMELAQLLRAASNSAMRNVNTCLPGTITAYDAGKQMASVQPMLKMTQPDGRVESLPVINNVPVVWPRSGGASLTFPVSSGDGCLLIFSQRSIDEYKEKGEESSPLDPRAFDLSDAVAFMGMVGFGQAGGPSDAVELKFGGVSLRLSGDGVTITGDVKINGSLHVTEDVLVGGDIDYHGESDDLTP